MMVKDHTSASDTLKKIASTLNVALPGSISNAGRNEIDELKKEKGKDFDKVYVHMMEDDRLQHCLCWKNTWIPFKPLWRSSKPVATGFECVE